MPNDKSRTAKFNPAKLKQLLGRPPVLRSESRGDYDKLFKHLIKHFEPRDIVEVILLDHLVYEIWIFKRYSRHQVVALERRHQQLVAFQIERRKAQGARKEKLASEQADIMTSTPSDIMQMIKLEDTVQSGVAEVDEIIRRTPSEREHNRALEASVAFNDQLDKWLSNAKVRLNKTLERLEQYREGLGQRLRQPVQEVLDADYEEVEGQRDHAAAPRLAPSAPNDTAPELVTPAPPERSGT
jgi:hypothetical protein